MYKAKLISFFIFFLLQLIVAAQFKVRKLSGGHESQKPSLIFPVFTSNNKEADKKINEYLQEKILFTTTSKTTEKKIFDEGKFIRVNDSMEQPGYTDMSFTIEVNNKNILSIIFEIESMGAYPEYYKRFYSFNSKKGEPITANELFTKEGLATIKKNLIEERDKRIKEQINWIKADNVERFKEDSALIVENFAECNAEPEEKNIFINKEEIIFYKEECFPHAWRAYGTDLDIVFSNKDLEKYLSEFGKRILYTK